MGYLWTDDIGAGDEPLEVALIGNAILAASMPICQPVGSARIVAAPLDASFISDELGRGEHAAFIGAFVGRLVYDLIGQG